MSHSSWVDTHPPYAYVRPLFFLFALFQLPLFAQSAIRIVPDNAVASSVATPALLRPQLRSMKTALQLCAARSTSLPDRGSIAALSPTISLCGACL